ncbi:DUF222 domain-containing protein [Phycicoccus endophyticus]|uniref:DUF222 domain-containing protein n=1 Tax=Phycicoccus endophyticus TaxID=1690220 RepID=A0A7G9R2V2_9MICO|nr:HNH endonuclease signature motif containing protein [Phycicoccus endophyticus]NHI20399.1 DUF222 domain-containing protein [Phycicoccus endophyticus]QNN49927.1 DUF222 domain-containing protein [Phycicoccus endophyticus]GGL29537.1 hypothetical protein GCM10012283_09870 [Phycicoccus endophyticus]
MARGTLDLAEHRSRLEAARSALTGLAEVLHEASGPELAEVMGLVDGVAAGAEAARVEVAVEAARRGECTGGGVHGWVREHAPATRQGSAGHVARLVQEVTAQDTGVQRVDPEPSSPLGVVWGAVRSARVSAPVATAVLRESTRLVPVLTPEAVPTVTSALVDLVEQWGPAMMRRLRPRLLADHGRVGVLDELHERLAASARLSAPHVESADLTEYQLWMTPEQAAALEAAIGPLSAPAPNPESGERDLRPAGQRRVEALTAVCRRSSALDAERAGADGPAGSWSAVHLTIPAGDLLAGTGAAEVLGSVATGTLLPHAGLRRAACDTALVAHVLGADGEPLALGRTVRLFTRAQRRHLWLRDRGCSYPGCTAPAAWAEAHHLTHWADGGRSDVGNAALLCPSHHTHVHRRRLAGTVTGAGVSWDLTPGSYDAALRARPPEPAGRAPDPPPGPPPVPEDPSLDLEQWWAELTEDDWAARAA